MFYTWELAHRRHNHPSEIRDSENYVLWTNPISASLTDDQLSISKNLKEVTIQGVIHDGSSTKVADDIVSIKS